MSRHRPRRTLGQRLEARRTQLGLTQTQAAAKVGVSRTTWDNWVTGKVVPAVQNHAAIAAFCLWEPDSVADVLDGRDPTPLRENLATVTPLRPDVAHSPPTDPALDGLISEWRDVMHLPEAFVQELVDEYQAERTRAYSERIERYRDRARRAAEG